MPGESESTTPDAYKGDFDSVHELQDEIRLDDDLEGEKIELTQEEKDRIARKLEQLINEFSEALRTLNDYETRESEETNKNTYHSFIFNGSHKAGAYLANPYLYPKIDGMWVNLPISSGEGFYAHFYRFLLGKDANIRDLLPRDLLEEIENIHDKTNKVAAEIINDDEEAKKIYVRYRYVNLLLNDKVFSDDFFVTMMDTNPDKFNQLCDECFKNKAESNIEIIRRELENKVRSIEIEVMKSDPSIIDEYRHILERLKKLVY